MPKFNLEMYLSATIEAPTLEAAQQMVDDAIDLSELRRRGIDVEGINPSIRKASELNTMTGTSKE